MKLSTRSRYGVRLMMDIASHCQSGPVQLAAISKRQDISEKYLGQIVILLKSAGLLVSERGKNGGYFPGRNLSEITLREIVEVLEGGISLTGCSFEQEPCSKIDNSVTAGIWKRLSDDMASAMEKISLQNLLDDEKNSSHLNYSI